MGLVNGEERIAQQGQGADQIGVSTARVIFTQARILAPMEPDFDSCPVIANVLEPFLERMSGRGPIADVVAGFVEWLTVASAGMVDPQRTTCVGEIDFHRLNSAAADSPDLVASMPLVRYVGKRGVAAVRRARRALSLGWLPLTCSK
jgi:hypothetical protein